MAKQSPSYSPTKHGGPEAVGIGEWPMGSIAKVASQGPDLGDENMIGGKMPIGNAHPHHEHSVGYEDSSNATAYNSHGIDAFHIKHAKREKGAEHHPPQARM